MRPAVQQNDPRLMDHFREDHHVPGRLHDLVIVVVAGGMHDGRHTAGDTAGLTRYFVHNEESNLGSFSSLCRSANSCLASGVSGGSRPSGGSMINDVLRNGLPISEQLSCSRKRRVVPASRTP